jgi:hypothetical protein
MNNKDKHDLGEVPIPTASPIALEHDDTFGKPLCEIDDVEWLRNSVEILWQLLDNIDTADDVAKDNDKGYRRIARHNMAKRFAVLTSDGYDLFLPSVS